MWTPSALTHLRYSLGDRAPFSASMPTQKGGLDGHETYLMFESNQVTTWL